MSEYITKAITSIMNDSKLEFPLNMAMSSAWLAGHFKGSELKILDMKGKTTLADYFVLASASNPTQLISMSDAMVGELKKFGKIALSQEGRFGGQWVLIDFGDIIVHLFLEEARYSYNLDDLFANAPQVEIPQSYYFSEPKGGVSKNDDDDNYF